MELRHLRYFVAVAEELNFSRAASRLHVSQPPLSTQILQLEREIGTRLLHRNHHSVSLTEPGRIFLERAREILASVNDAVDESRAVGARMDRRLSVCIAHFLAPLIAPIVSAFERKHPRVVVEIQQNRTCAVIDAVRTGTAVIGYARSCDNDANLMFAPVFEEGLRVAISSRHPLARGQRISLNALEHEKWMLISRHVSPILHGRMMAALHEAGVAPDIYLPPLVDVEEISAMWEAVAEGRCVALVVDSALSTKPRSTAARILRIDPPVKHLTIFELWRKKASDPVLHDYLEISRRTRTSPSRARRASSAANAA